jgi:ribosome biogenesis GTPase
MLGEISGKFHYTAETQEDLPAVGDWVTASLRIEEGRATIHHVLPRKSKFSRKVAGSVTQEQIVAANIDTVFIVNSLNHNFNLRRIERYLILAWESGANPVIILSKADLYEQVAERMNEVAAIAPGVPVFAVSSLTGSGLDEIKGFLFEGSTTALLGSSGVGKSTLINSLMGDEVQKVQQISGFEDKGRHTSTHRELFILPNGSLMIDTPGMRELQMWDGEDGLSEAFDDIEQLSKQCKFTDCSHRNEPGCAVKAAIKNGSLSYDRFENYKKLQKEIKFIEEKQRVLERAQKKNLRNKIYEARNKKPESIEW